MLRFTLRGIIGRQQCFIYKFASSLAKSLVVLQVFHSPARERVLELCGWGPVHRDRLGKNTQPINLI